MRSCELLTVKIVPRARVQYHPDRNPGNEEAQKKMQEISAAWDVLQDDEKRAIYDQHGLEGLQGMGGGAGGGFADIFDLFGGGFGGRRREKPTKTDDTRQGLQVELPDLYKGRTRTFRISRNVLCPGCTGTGGKNGKKPTKCTSCDGHGVKIVVRQLGPGMMQQMQAVCPECRGEGQQLAKADRCDTCQGAKLTEKQETIELVIRPGTKHNEAITLHGKGNEAPGLAAGDVVFIVQEAQHPVFTRDGDDLRITKKLTLSEALCGFSFNVTTLDNRVLNVVSKPGEVISPGLIKGISDEGMPRNKNPALFGTLFIQFEIEFPDSLPEASLAPLRALLPPAPAVPMVPADAETVHLNVQYREKQEQHNQYDEDDGSGGGGGPGVQCRQG